METISTEADLFENIANEAFENLEWRLKGNHDHVTDSWELKSA